MGIRASGRVLEKSHTSIMRWEQKLATQSPPSESKGWTVTFIERTSRYWIVAKVGLKNTDLFEKATQIA
jgi:hypothetical protein